MYPCFSADRCQKEKHNLNYFSFFVVVKNRHGIVNLVTFDQISVAFGALLLFLLLYTHCVLHYIMFFFFVAILL